MLLPAVSVLVVAQSSSEIPEGLMNNPVCCAFHSVCHKLSHQAVIISTRSIILLVPIMGRKTLLWGRNLSFMFTLYECQSSNLYPHCTDGVFFISCYSVQLVLLQSKPRESPVVIVTSGVWCPTRGKILLLPLTTILALNPTQNDGSFRHNKAAETWCWYLTSFQCIAIRPLPRTIQDVPLNLNQ